MQLLDYYHNFYDDYALEQIEINNQFLIIYMD